MSAALIETARFERDRRERLGPERAAEIERTSASPAEAEQRLHALCVDVQAWEAIAGWLETGRLSAFEGMDDDGQPLVRWPDLERAAEAALAATSERIARLEADPAAKPETLGELRERRSCLFVIHRKVQWQRQGVESINAEFRSRREGRAITVQPEGIAA